MKKPDIEKILTIVVWTIILLGSMIAFVYRAYNLLKP
jgi:hypothetical protein